MSNRIDWGDLKPIQQNSGIDWGDLQPVQQESQGLKLPGLGIGKRVNPNGNVQGMKRDVGRAAKTVAANTLGTPFDLIDLLTFHQGKWPTSEEFTKGIEDLFPSTKPMNPEEKERDEGMGLLTQLLTPIPGAKYANPKIADYLSKVGKYFRGGKKVSEAALKKAGTALGLTERQLAPLFSGKMAPFFSKFSNKGKKAAEAVKESQGALGNVYDKLSGSEKAKQFISTDAEDVLIDGLKKFRQKLGTTLANSGEEKTMLNFAQDALDKIINKSGVTPEELMNFYRSIGSNVNWKSIQGGKKRLGEIKRYVSASLKSADPHLAKQFEHTNKLWERSEQVLEAVGPKKFNEFMHHSNAAALIGSLVGAVSSGNFAAIPVAIGGLAAKKGIGVLATKMMTDPKWQNIFARSIGALKGNSPKSAQSIAALIKPLAKDELSEEEYNQIFKDL